VNHGYAEDKDRATQFRWDFMVRRLAVYDRVLTLDLLEGRSRDRSVAFLSRGKVQLTAGFMSFEK
jgi:hypothetical protein